MASTPLTIALIYDYESSGQVLGLSPKYSDPSIKGISAALEALSHHVVHIEGLSTLVSQLANGNYTQRDLAFNVAGGVFGLAREAQVPCLLEAYWIPFTFSDAATTSLCSGKGRTKVREDSFITYLVLKVKC